MREKTVIPQPEPLAYFLTWTTYGTWLPGDERGWVERKSGFRLPAPLKKFEALARMTEDACRLSEPERSVVESTIFDHCRIRNWPLYAANCRSNHVHVVVASDKSPRVVRDQLKAWCTRRLKDLVQPTPDSPSSNRIRTNWWSERGSCRYINDADSLEAAILYVRDAQDRPRT